MPLASELASIASDVYRSSMAKPIPYKRGGCALDGMDSGGFITYCLSRIGVSAKYKGTNDMYRDIGNQRYGLLEARSSGLLVPGVLLFYVQKDGMPDNYKKDGLGNADFAAISISANKAVYPSQMKGTLIETQIDDKIISGRLNTVVLCKHLVYPSSSRPTLKKGSDGEAVKEVQQMLKDHSYLLAVDGEFGPATEAAVRAFQRDNNLLADGVVGVATWEELLKR